MDIFTTYIFGKTTLRIFIVSTVTTLMLCINFRWDEQFEKNIIINNLRITPHESTQTDLIQGMYSLFHIVIFKIFKER